MYKIQASNEYKSFFLKNEGIDICFSSKSKSIEYFYSIYGIYTELLGYKLKIKDIPNDLYLDLKDI